MIVGAEVAKGFVIILLWFPIVYIEISCSDKVLLMELVNSEGSLLSIHKTAGSPGS